MTTRASPSGDPASDSRRLEWGFPYATLAWIGVAFGLGCVAVLLFQNALGKEILTFSTTGLISFLFGIALAAASTVLSVAAILLAKVSEYAMIQRSDASIRLQNEVFVKTTEALARIESSTGVTEKRIEDIISGRAGRISKVVAEKLGVEGATSGLGRANVEREIKETIEAEVRRASVHDADVVRQSNEDKRKYRHFQNQVLATVANTHVVSCEKVGDGKFGSSGSDMFDGIFSRNGQRVAVSTFSTLKGLAGVHLRHFKNFLLAAAVEMESQNLHSVVVAFDGPTAPNGQYRALVERVSKLIKPDLARRFVLLDGEDGAAAQKVADYIAGIDGPASLRLASS